MVRAFCGAVAALLVIPFLFIWATAPENYLADNATSSTRGWQVNGSTIDLVAGAPPIEGQPVLRLVATAADGNANLFSRQLPRGQKVFSIYLRSDERTDLRLHAYWPHAGGEQVVVRVESHWRRFVLAVPAHHVGRIWVGIGGQESFSKGKSVEISAPEVSVGTSTRPFAPAHLQDLGWLDWRVEDLALRTVSAPLGWAALAAVVCWLLTYADIRRRLQLGARWSASGNRRTVLTYVGVIAATWLGVEAISFAACVVIAMEKVPLGAAVQEVWNDGLKSNDGPAIVDAATTTFSPLTQIRRLVGTPEIGGRFRLPFVANRLGLVDNDAPSPDWDVMPEKPPGMIRVILYGGSTAMGIGARDGTETLSAQLERLLNANAAPGTVFQVLNFGHGAAQSYTTLQFMASMGSYLKPDVSIELDGFNDAFFATESEPLTKSLPYIINWANYSYYFDSAFNGLARKPWPHFAMLPFSSQLVGRLSDDEGGRAAKIKAYYDAMPMRVLTEWLEKTSTPRANLLAHNLRFIAGYFVHRDEYLLSYLQPHPWQFRKLMTVPVGNEVPEETRVKDWVGRGSAWPLEEYRTRMVNIFTAYAGVYAGLAKEYAEFPNIRFYDIRDLYEDFPQPAYRDIIHYTPAAQKWMAQRIYRDLTTVPIVRGHILQRHDTATRKGG
ncbi:MAG TPA: hypothetical protein VGM96_22770 [Reyranella sp.]|jgi:hypothetical protein